MALGPEDGTGTRWTPDEKVSLQTLYQADQFRAHRKVGYVVTNHVTGESRTTETEAEARDLVRHHISTNRSPNSEGPTP